MTGGGEEMDVTDVTERPSAIADIGGALVADGEAPRRADPPDAEVVLDVRDLSVWYGDFLAVRGHHGARSAATRSPR